MGMTYASFMQFYENVDMSMLWSICHRGGRKGGATATITKTVPQQRSSFGNSIEIPMQRRNVRMHAKDGGALPDSGCPTSWRQGNEWQFGHGANSSISNIASIHSLTSSRGYTFEACVIEGVRVRCGVGEVDVLAMAVVEVVDLACSRVDSRGSCFVVVQGRR